MSTDLIAPEVRPYVLCVGLPLDRCTEVAELIGAGAVVVATPDTVGARALLDANGAAPDPPPTGAAPDVVEHGSLALDRSSRELRWNGTVVGLSAREFDVLSVMATRPEKVWTFEELSSAVWRSSFVGDGDAVVSAVKRLRKRTEALREVIRIVSVRGIGFRLRLAE